LCSSVQAHISLSAKLLVSDHNAKLRSAQYFCYATIPISIIRRESSPGELTLYGVCHNATGPKMQTKLQFTAPILLRTLGMYGNSSHAKCLKDTNFNMLSYGKFPFHQTLMIIDHTHSLGQRSRQVIFKGHGHSVYIPYSHFNNLNRYGSHNMNTLEIHAVCS
jgi:hypothetical protein